jgi:hypothetical protein
MTAAKTIDKSESSAGFAFLLVFALLAAGIVATGHLYYRNYERHYRAEAEHQFAGIAELKVGVLQCGPKGQDATPEEVTR